MMRIGIAAWVGLAALGCGPTKAEPDLVHAPDSSTPPTSPAVARGTDAAPEAPSVAAPSVAAPSVAGPWVAASAAAPPLAAPTSHVVDGQRVLAKDALPGLVAFAEQWPGKGTIWVGRLAGNGGRDVLVFLPPGFDPEAGVRLVFHFHGTHSQKIIPPGPGIPKKDWVGHTRLTQTMEAIAQLQADTAGNVALIYPLSAGKRPEPGWQGWFNKDYDRMWMARAPEPGYTDDFDRLYDESVAVLTETLGVASARIEGGAVAEGHSAGGVALRNIAEHGTTHVGEYLFLDASFQSWADRCWAAARQGRPPARVTIVQTTRGIADPHQGRDPWCRTMPVQAAAWPDAKGWCGHAAKPAKAKPPGRKETCQTLQTAFEAWPEFQGWCSDLSHDFEGIEGLTLVRTKVSHGDQPRAFSGGLGLSPR